MVKRPFVLSLQKYVREGVMYQTMGGGTKVLEVDRSKQTHGIVSFAGCIRFLDSTVRTRKTACSYNSNDANTI